MVEEEVVVEPFPVIMEEGIVDPPLMVVAEEGVLDPSPMVVVVKEGSLYPPSVVEEGSSCRLGARNGQYLATHTPNLIGSSFLLFAAP